MASGPSSTLVRLSGEVDNFTTEEIPQIEEKLFEHEVNQQEQPSEEQLDFHDKDVTGYSGLQYPDPEASGPMSLRLPTVDIRDIVGGLFDDYQHAGGAINYEPTDARASELFDNLEQYTDVVLSPDPDNPQEILKLCNPNPHFSRYDNIGCPEATQVKLDPIDGVDIKTNVMNANYVDLLGNNKVIATQYPYNSEEGRAYFWYMVWNKKVDVIVDLSRPKDDVGAPYFLQQKPVPSRASNDVKNKALNPEQLFSLNSKKAKSAEAKSSVLLKLTAKFPPQGNVDTSTYKVTFNNRTNNILRQHYQGWEDHCAVNVDQFNSLLEDLNTLNGKNLLIHCRAGAGRTMTVVAGLELKRQFAQGKINRENYQEIVFNTVMRLRYQRGPKSVQTEEQFKLLLQTVYGWVEEAESGSTEKLKSKVAKK